MRRFVVTTHVLGPSAHSWGSLTSKKVTLPKRQASAQLNVGCHLFQAQMQSRSRPMSTEVDRSRVEQVIEVMVSAFQIDPGSETSLKPWGLCILFPIPIPLDLDKLHHLQFEKRSDTQSGRIPQ